MMDAGRRRSENNFLAAIGLAKMKNGLGLFFSARRASMKRALGKLRLAREEQFPKPRLVWSSDQISADVAARNMSPQALAPPTGGSKASRAISHLPR